MWAKSDPGMRMGAGAGRPVEIQCLRDESTCSQCQLPGLELNSLSLGPEF